MPRKLLTHEFDVGFSETWAFKTDVLQSRNRTEQRIALLPYPNERLSVTAMFGADGSGLLNAADATVKSLTDLAHCEGEVSLPMWHLGDTVSVLSNWHEGTKVANIVFSATYSPFEAAVGERALVRVGQQWVPGTIVAYLPSPNTVRVDFGFTTGYDLNDFRIVVPIRDGLASASSMNYRKVNFASQKLDVLLESTYRSNFGTGYSLNLSSSFDWPIVEMRGTQDSLALEIQSGNELQETASGFPYYVTRWAEAGLKVSFTNKFDRYSANLRYWRAFAMAVRGSQQPFWFPTRRSDFDVLSGDENGVLLRGRQFFDLWTQTNIKALCLDSFQDPICVRFAAACELSGNDTLVQFDSALPWSNSVRQCSLAFPCRLEGDAFQFKHDQRCSTISFQATNINVTYAEEALTIDEDLFFHIDASLDSNGYDFDGNYVSLPQAGTIGGATSAVYKNTPAGALKGNRLMVFTPRQFDPTLDGTLDVYLWSDTLLTQFRQGDLAGADLQFEGQGEIPRVYILPGGDPEVPAKALGVARYIESWDEIPTAIDVSRVTAAEYQRSTYKLYFADVTYFDPYWWPAPYSMNDRSGNANHLLAAALGTVIGHRDASRYLLGPGGLWCLAPSGLPVTPGPTMLTLVGKMVDSTIGDAVSLGDVGSDVVSRDSAGGGVFITHDSAESDRVGSIAVGDEFLLVVVLNGANSEIHLLVNDETEWTGAVVDNGALDLPPVYMIASGAFHWHAVLFSEVPADVVDYRNGLAYQYGFSNTYQNTAVQLGGEPEDWALLHDDSEDYVFSLAIEVVETAQEVTNFFELLNSTGTGGLKLDWIQSTQAIRVTYTGEGPAEVTEDFVIGHEGSIIFELAYASGSVEAFLEGESIGTLAVGLTFETTQDSLPVVGTDSGVNIGEIILRRGSELQADYLIEKWFVAEPEDPFEPQSLYFDGASRLTASADGSPAIPITSYCDFSFSASHAIVAWIRPQLSGLAAPVGLVSRRNPATGLATGSTHYIKPDGRLGGYIAGLDSFSVPAGAHAETTASALANDTWQHVIINYNGGAAVGSKWSFLVNASDAPRTSIGDVIASAVTGSHADPMIVGGDEDGYEGWIKHIVIYDQIITGADAAALYNGGVLVDPRTVTSGGIDSNLIGYLACGEDGDLTSMIINRAGAQEPREYPNFAGVGVTFSDSLPGDP